MFRISKVENPSLPSSKSTCSVGVGRDVRQRLGTISSPNPSAESKPTSTACLRKLSESVGYRLPTLFDPLVLTVFYLGYASGRLFFVVHRTCNTVRPFRTLFHPIGSDGWQCTFHSDYFSISTTLVVLNFHVYVLIVVLQKVLILSSAIETTQATVRAGLSWSSSSASRRSLPGIARLPRRWRTIFALSGRASWEATGTRSSSKDVGKQGSKQAEKWGGSRGF